MPRPVAIHDLDALAAHVVARATADRMIVALVGAPGSGKSTAAAMLQTTLQRAHGQTVQIVPMDGFHYDDGVLAQLGLAGRKGAPETFDVAGLESVLTRLSSGFEPGGVAVPVFDRTLELSRAGARLIDPATRIVLVEGNYLLLTDPSWARLHRFFDLTVMIACDEETLRERLLRRWRDLDHSPDDAARKVEGNDLPNARRVLADSAPADCTLASD